MQLSPKGTVNSGGYTPRREGLRHISTALHREGIPFTRQTGFVDDNFVDRN